MVGRDFGQRFLMPVGRTESEQKFPTGDLGEQCVFSPSDQAIAWLSGLRRCASALAGSQTTSVHRRRILYEEGER